MRRNQKRIAELNATIRKLEDRNTLLGDERNELVSSKQIYFILLFFKHFVIVVYTMLYKYSTIKKSAQVIKVWLSKNAQCEAPI